jgi:GT2 family glycosyltransferase
MGLSRISPFTRGHRGGPAGVAVRRVRAPATAGRSLTAATTLPPPIPAAAPPRVRRSTRRSVTAVVVAYEPGAELITCLEALQRGAATRSEIIVVANSPLSPELADNVRTLATRVVDPGRNLGFGAACNLGAEVASGDVLVFLNPDVVVGPGALDGLARTLDDRAIGIATARLRLLRTPERLNSSGNVLHITGLGWVGDFEAPVETAREVRDVAFPSGAALAIRRSLFRRLGGFREDLFLYHEDVDLGWRAHMRGYRVVMTPHADAYHDYSFSRNPRKHYFLERNRLVFLASNFSWRLILLLAPLLLAVEVGMAALAWREGWLRDKLAGWTWCIRNVGTLARRRRETQRTRQVPDRKLAELLTAVIDPRVIRVPLVVKLANPLLIAYWALVRRAL